MAPMMDLATRVQEMSGLLGQPSNAIDGILRTVRVPTAQMDVFSVVLQVCADHLIMQGSAPEVADAFKKIVEACGFFGGAGYRVTELSNEGAAACYRSMHWY